MDRFQQASLAATAQSRRASSSRQYFEGADRALVLGLDAECLSVVCEVLSTEFETRMTNSIEVALGLLASREYEAIVIDASMATDVTLPTLLGHARSAQPVASILATSQVPLRSAEIVDCLNADADDYLPAPFHPSELLARTLRGVRRARHLRTVERMRPLEASLRGEQRATFHQHGATERALVATARAS